MSQRWSYERAYVHTKMIRGCILPNAGFEVVLAEMGEEFCPAREMPSPGVPSPELARREEDDAEATPAVRLAAGGVPAGGLRCDVHLLLCRAYPPRNDIKLISNAAKTLPEWIFPVSRSLYN